jgi:hypothetical protein
MQLAHLPLDTAARPDRFNPQLRAKAAGVHLLISLAVAALIAALVFGLWYPGAYRLLSGGRELFLLVISVDVVLGPLLTFAVFNLRKGWPHLRRDLAVIALLQLSALGYGMYTVCIARPVAMVFEVDRFRVLTTNDVYTTELPKARPEYRRLPLTGPWLLGARKPQGINEKNDALMVGLEGIDIGQRPMFWQPYADSISDALARAKPVARLLNQYPTPTAELLREFKVDNATARYLPVLARGNWVAILDAHGAIAGFIPVDGFF